MSLDISAEVNWPYFNYFVTPAESCVELRELGVSADAVAVCMASARLSPEMRTLAAQLVTHTIGQRRAAKEYKPGIDAETAQGRIDAMTRLCMYELEWQSTN